MRVWLPARKRPGAPARATDQVARKTELSRSKWYAVGVPATASGCGTTIARILDRSTLAPRGGCVGSATSAWVAPGPVGTGLTGTRIGGEAVVVEREAQPRAAGLDVGRRPVVEQHLRLVEHRGPPVDGPDGVDHALGEVLQGGVEDGAAGGVGALLPLAARPGLVEDVEAEDPWGPGEVRRDVGPGGGVPVLEPDLGRARVVGP